MHIDYQLYWYITKKIGHIITSLLPAQRNTNASSKDKLVPYKKAPIYSVDWFKSLKRKKCCVCMLLSSFPISDHTPHLPGIIFLLKTLLCDCKKDEGGTAAPHPLHQLVLPFCLIFIEYWFFGFIGGIFTSQWPNKKLTRAGVDR